jgi:glycosyltransferase involved in cell wall biosynthesis
MTSNGPSKQPAATTVTLRRGPAVPPTPPRVSVIIPTHRPVYLDEALDSVRAQTFGDYEIIVIDDGSPDPAAPARADDLTLIRQPNAGAAAARNRGIEHARGELLAFLDHDDRWQPLLLERLVAFFDAHPTVVLACTELSFMDQPEGRWLARYGHQTGIFPYDDLLRENCLGTSASLVRAEAARAVGGFDVSQRYTEDYRFWLELGLVGELGFVNEPLAVYRRHETSVTACGRQSGVWQVAELQVYTRLMAAHPELATRPALIDGLARAEFDRGYAMLQRGDFCTARAAFRASLGHRRWRRRTWLNLLRAVTHQRPKGA